MKVKLISIFTILALTLSSCATLFTGTKDRISFATNPSGAGVYIDGLKVCETPCTEYVKRSLTEKEVEFKLDGYKTQVVVLDREFNAVSILNLAGMVGWAVDAATGAIFKYDRKHYDIDMELDRALSMKNVHMVEINTDNKTVVLHAVEQTTKAAAISK